MRDALEQFLIELAAQRRASPHTVSAYRRDIARVLDLAGGPGRPVPAEAWTRELLERAGGLGIRSLVLEVRVSNFAAQALYRAQGFRLAGLRRRYYRDTGEDALVMRWQRARAAGAEES